MSWFQNFALKLNLYLYITASRVLSEGTRDKTTGALVGECVQFESR
jgi:hypothetical protein